MTKTGFFVALQGVAIVLAVGLLLGTPPAARADSLTDGLGTMAVATGGPVIASSTGNTLTFTYTADPTAGITAGTVQIDVPDGWTAPQSTDSLAAGYVSTGAGIPTTSAGSDGTGGTITVSLLTLLPGQQVQITYTGASAPSTAGTDTFTAYEGDGTDTPVQLPASPSVQVLTVPGSPTLASPTSGNGQVSLSWTAPSDDGGAAVTDYVIDEYVGGDTSGTAIPIDTSSANTSAVVSGLTNGQQYTFTVTAENSVGSGVASASQTATLPAVTPDSPTGLSVSPGTGQAQLSWAAPTDDGGAPVIDYVIDEYAGSGTTGTPTVIDTKAASLSATVPGLSNGQQYTFTVTAVNSVGSGAASGSQTVTLATVAPGAPTGLSASRGNGQVSLSWTAPTDDGGAPVTDYVIDEYAGGDTSGTPTAIDTNSANTSAVVSGLTNGQHYTFTVTAENSVGPGTAAGPLSSTPATTPSAPTLAPATFGDGQVSLSWTAPADDGGASVTDYVVDEYVGGDTSGTPIAIDTNSVNTSATVPGLTNGQPYTFTVTAENSAGPGSPSASVSSTPATTPGAPALASPTPGNGQVQLSWAAPAADGGAPVTDYVIDEYAGGDTTGTPTVIDTGSANTSATVPGLTNGQEYSFTVTAKNLAGPSTASSPVSSTPATVPGAPNLIATVAGSTLVEVVWDPPAANGGAAITGYEIFRSTGVGAQGSRIATVGPGSSTNTYIDQSVSDGVTYYYEVVATNSVGPGSASSQFSAEPLSSRTQPALVKTMAIAGHEVTFSAPNQCIRGGRVTGQVSVSSKAPSGRRVMLGKAVFTVGRLATKTVSRRRQSTAPIRVMLRVRHMVTQHSYAFVARPLVGVGKSSPRAHTLRLRITAC